MTEKQTLTPDQVEEIYNIPKQTLANWRSLKVGPPYSKAGRRILYRVKDLESFLDRCQRKTTGHLPA
jgi:hypothetical protein